MRWLTLETTYEILLPVQSGSEQLSAWIKRCGFKTNVQAAEHLGIPGIDDVVLNKILNAGRRPELEKLILIEEKTGVPVRSWATSMLDESETVSARGGKKGR